MSLMNPRKARWRLWLALAVVLAAGYALVLKFVAAPPLAPELPEDARWAAAPPSTVALEVTPLVMGRRKIPRCVAAGKASCFASAEVVHVSYLVKHPQGTFLIDAGLSSHARDDLAKFALKERLALDWTPEGDLKEDLVAQGSPKIDFVVLTHDHWDHTSGLVDLPHPHVLMGPGEVEFGRAYPKSKPPAVMPEHLQGAVVEPFAWDGPAYENFPKSHDVFRDGSVVLVPLPGHTPGSLGVFLNNVHGRRLLFVGDAAWSRSGYELPSHKPRPVSDLVDHDRAALSQTLWRLHELHLHAPELIIVPAHDADGLADVRALKGAH